jgi:hypothetical protein
MMNVHQAAQARPEHVVISFGFLHFHYSKIENHTDLAACTAVLASAERRWGQCDQEVFIAAVIINPFYKILPFQKIPLTTCAGLAALFGRLWSRFYNSDAPLDLYTDLEDYMSGSHDFAHIDVYKFALLSHAEKEVCSQVDFSRKFTKIIFRVLQLIQLISGMDCHILGHHLDDFILLPCAFSLSAQILPLVSAFLVCLARF